MQEQRMIISTFLSKFLASTSITTALLSVTSSAVICTNQKYNIAKCKKPFEWQNCCRKVKRYAHKNEELNDGMHQ